MTGALWLGLTFGQWCGVVGLSALPLPMVIIVTSLRKKPQP